MRTEGEAASPGIAAALEYSVTRPHGDLDAAEKHGRRFEWIVGHVDTSGIKPRLVIKHRSFIRCSHMKAGPVDSLRGRQVASCYASPCLSH